MSQGSNNTPPWNPGSQNEPDNQSQWPPQQASYGQTQHLQQDPYQQNQVPNPYAGQPQNQYPGQHTGQYPQQNIGYDQTQYPNQYQRPAYQALNNNEYVSYDQRASRIVGGVLGTIVFAAALFGAIWYYRAMHPAPVPAPTAFTQFSVSDSSFSIPQPVGWNTDSGQSNGVEGNATFTYGKAKIYADSTLGGSLQGDILTASNAQQQNIADQLGRPAKLTPPIITLHREGEAAEAALYNNYSEQPMQPFNCPLGQGYYSEFTGDAGTFTGKIHGYRATVLTNERQIAVFTICRQSDWNTLQPAFMHELEGLDRGKGSS